MNAHSPGPWTHDKFASAGGAPVITAATCWMGSKRDIAKVLYHNGSEDPEVDANARLIAAAPELARENAELREQVAQLLQALKEADQLYTSYGLTAASVECGKWINAARAAIAKAES